MARSAYKLQEIQQKHKLIPPGGQILDLGCHPGAWLQVACESLGPLKKGGRVIGVDIQVRCERCCPVACCGAGRALNGSTVRCRQPCLLPALGRFALTCWLPHWLSACRKPVVLASSVTSVCLSCKRMPACWDQSSGKRTVQAASTQCCQTCELLWVA